MKLKQVRQVMVDRGIVRTSINRNIGRIRRMFKWGVENELVDPTVHTALTARVGLRYGRSPATESSPVLPVPDADIEAVKPFVSRQVWAMIQLQLAAGMRPGEARIMRVGDINMSGDPWEYRPQEHKTQHHGRDRVIFIGPIGQALVRPFLKADRDRHLFSPAEARAEFDAERRENRVSPMTPSQRARKRLADPQKQPGPCYSVTSYARPMQTDLFSSAEHIRRNRSKGGIALQWAAMKSGRCGAPCLDDPFGLVRIDAPSLRRSHSSCEQAQLPSEWVLSGTPGWVCG